MTLLTGYRSKSNLNATQMFKLMEKMKTCVDKKWMGIYMDLLSDEVNMVADSYVLNRLNIADNYSILDVAEERVCARVSASSHADVFTRYNASVMLEVMPYNGKWYVLVVCNNPILRKGLLDDIDILEPFNVSESEIKRQNEKVWEGIRKSYTDKSYPFRVNYFPRLPMQIDPNDLKFQPKTERAFYQALSNERASILAALSPNQAIPPQEVIRYVDEIEMERGLSDLHDVHVQENTGKLLEILPDLTVELITMKRGVKPPEAPEEPVVVDQEEKQVLN